MMSLMRKALIGVGLLLLTHLVFAQDAAEQDQPNTGPARPHAEIFYKSGNLNIQAYLYKPDGDGPFPIVIYNHGSRFGRERQSFPFEWVGQMLTAAGFAVLIPERRGYGRSDGPIFTSDVGTDREARFVDRLKSEADDAVAAIAYLRSVPFADNNRIGIMGWSFGGIVTMLSISRSPEFKVAVNQAGGAQTWTHSRSLRQELTGAAQKTNTPVLLLVAISDSTTDSVATLAPYLKARNVPHKLIVYDSKNLAADGRSASDLGHRTFSRDGAAIWRNDVIEFLNLYLKADATREVKREAALELR